MPCANVANLVLARAAGRTREMGGVGARPVGATRWQVIRQMLIEVLVLAVGGALVGLALAQLGITLFNRAIVDTNPLFWIDIRIDRMVMLFVTVSTLLVTLLAGIVPAVRASRADLAAVMGDEGRTTGMKMGRFSRILVVGELAVSFGLLLVAGLTIQSIVDLSKADFGFAMKDVWSARVVLPASDYPDEERRRRFAESALGRVQALPGVVSVAAATGVPIGGPRYAIKLPDRQYASDRDYHQVHGLVTSSDYFRVLRVPTLEGRPFDGRDAENGAPSVIVNQSFARKLPPAGRPRAAAGADDGRAQDWREIVGVVPNLGMGENPGDDLADAIYLPLAQVPAANLTLLAHALRTTAQSLRTGARCAARRRSEPAAVQHRDRAGELRAEHVAVPGVRLAVSRVRLSPRCSWRRSVSA